MPKEHSLSDLEQAPETEVSEPIPSTLQVAIGKGSTDQMQWNQAYAAMRDALQFGLSLEPVFRIQADLYRLTGDHSRVAGATYFLLDLLIEAESKGSTWTVPGSVSQPLSEAMILPGRVRNSALAGLPDSCEDEAVTLLCSMVEDLHKKKPFNFKPGQFGGAAPRRPAHRIDKVAAKKHIPAVQYGRVIQN